LAILSISIPDKLSEELDASIEKRGFASRSEVLRQAIRFFLEEQRSLEKDEGEVIAIVTIVYEKTAKTGGMLAFQQEHRGIVSTFLHTHVDENSCLEVLVVKGAVHEIRELVDDARADKRVRQAKVTTIGAPY